MDIEYKKLTIEMYEQMAKGWSELPSNAIGIGDDKASILNYLDRNKNCSYAALIDNQLVGSILSGHDGRRGLLNHLFVHVDFRKQGIGKKLVQLSITELKKQGIKRCIIFIHKTNVVAQEFWKKIGFDNVDFIDTYGMDL